ncbi:vacuolar import and degradation protein-domain-containing protein [Roridomyces roridus]|uniref:Vacuolar import and degradation protein-domain-containing protein n=1 Tax=Roridomyces roridus TaxID=1738132 RepID=A0AAD7FMT8_9AGAR|nr:vacuolar import and degradation protein-domain-containing protein [Roridomyces roridus]
MPSENLCTVHRDEQLFKCTSCQCQVDAAGADSAPDAFVCAGCRAHLLAAITVLLPVERPSYPTTTTTPTRESPVLQRRRPVDDSFRTAPPPTAVIPVDPAPLAVSPRPQYSPARSPTKGDPLADITRLRVRAQTHHCLYPGASFQGTQKSGRNSYDVTVTIVDVDFASSFLCGYLRIRGLTDDWPELTTYFDAEIIGPRYGFLTQQNWGASEQADTVHWARFPAFRHVKGELKKPHLTMPDRDRGAVFMRWKERFLVPDHRVQEINGASFAGFYYVCVDFNPAPTHDEPEAMLEPDTEQLSSPPPHRKQRRDSSVCHSLPTHPRPALMSGFYFHQNSEPYQQLTLSHIPERTSSSFEFR